MQASILLAVMSAFSRSLHMSAIVGSLLPDDQLHNLLARVFLLGMQVIAQSLPAFLLHFCSVPIAIQSETTEGAAERQLPS